MSVAGDQADVASGRIGPPLPRVEGQQPLNKVSGRSIAAAAGSVVLFVYLVRAILFPFVIAGAFAFVCTPLIEAMALHPRLPRTAAAALVFVALVSVFGLLGWLAVPALLDEGKDIATHLRPIIENAIKGAIGTGNVSLMGGDTDAAKLASQAMDGLRKTVLQADVLATVAGGGVAGLFGAFLTLVLLFYFLAGGPGIEHGVLALVPPAQRPLAEAIWRQLSPVPLRYFAGVGVVVIYAIAIAIAIAIAAAYVGLGLFLHLKNAVLLAVLTGFAEMIPVVGPGAAAVIAGFAAIREARGVGAIIGYIVYATLLRLSIDQFIGPLVLGRAGRVNPTVIIFCFLAGGILFGVVGVVLATPVALAIRIILTTLYEEPLPGRRTDEGQAA